VGATCTAAGRKAEAWCLLIHADADASLSLSDSLATARPYRVTRYDPISIWQIDMGYRYGRSDINEM
jgi:hypothetical protein